MSKAKDFLKSKGVLKEDIRNLLDKNGIELTSKPNNWDEIGKTYLIDLPNNVKEEINKLKIFKSTDLYKGIPKVLDDYETKPNQTIFILTRKGKTYLVNNESYTYNRYITELVK
jgi:hypothetical protein